MQHTSTWGSWNMRVGNVNGDDYRMNVKYADLWQVSQVAVTWLTSALTISSGTLCTMETVAVEMGLCWLPLVLCNLGERQKKSGSCAFFWLVESFKKTSLKRKRLWKTRVPMSQRPLCKKKKKKRTDSKKKISSFTNWWEVLLEFSPLTVIFKVATTLLTLTAIKVKECIQVSVTFTTAENWEQVCGLWRPLLTPKYFRSTNITPKVFLY